MNKFCWSIIEHILFVMYTKDTKILAKKHDMSIHIYADDTQCYFNFNNNSSIETVQNEKRNIYSLFKVINEYQLSET